MIEKSMNWKRLRFLQAYSAILSTTAALFLALAGFGVYALFLPALLAPLPFIWDLFVTARWRPTWEFDWEYFKKAGAYGLTRAGSGVIVFGRQLIESGVLVQTVGYAQFGIFGRAIGLANLCCMKLPSFIMPLLFPVLSRYEIGTVEHKHANDLVLRSVTWSVLPTAILFSFLGGQVVHLLYGNRWTSATPLLPFAMAAAATTAISQTAGVLLVTSRQQHMSLMSDMALLVGTGMCLLFLLKGGLSAYLAGIVASQLISLALIVFWLIGGQVIEVKTIWATFTTPLVAATAAAMLCLILRRSISESLPALIYCIVLGTTFLLSYFAILRAVGSQPLHELLAYLPGGRVLRKALWLPS